MELLLKFITRYLNTLSWVSPELSAKQAFNLFAYPFSSKLRTEQQQFLHKSNMFELEVNSKKVQCYSWGDGEETILFVHGWQSNSYRWKQYVENLDHSRYTMYAFDAPGHGNSAGRICTIPHYEKCIDALINDKGIIDHFIGHSIGSFACASYLYHYNYNVKSYVSLASPYNAREFVDNFSRRLALSERGMTYLLAYFKSYTSYSLEHYSLEEFCNDLKSQGVLIVHDKEDKSTPYQNATKTYDLLIDKNQNTELVITEGLGHSLRGSQVIQLVKKWLH